MSRAVTGIATSQNDSSSPKRLSRFTSNTSWRNLALAIVLRQLQSGCGEESSSCSATVAAVDESVSTDTCSHTHLSLDPLWGIRGITTIVLAPYAASVVAKNNSIP